MDSGSGRQHPARDNGKAPAPPPPPHRHEENGGHRRGQRRRRRPRRRRGVALALFAMIPAAVYLLSAGSLAVPPALPSLLFIAYVLWILGMGLLFRSMMN